MWELNIGHERVYSRVVITLRPQSASRHHIFGTTTWISESVSDPVMLDFYSRFRTGRPLGPLVLGLTIQKR